MVVLMGELMLVLCWVLEEEERGKRGLFRLEPAFDNTDPAAAVRAVAPAASPGGLCVQ